MKKIFLKEEKKIAESFIELVRIMTRLYGKNGCPWDRAQTHKTLLKYLYEEVKEFKKAVKKYDYDNMKEELGDILLQVIFHCEIARSKNKFSVFDVIELLKEKLIRRHPHVFGNIKCKTPKDVKKIWREIKKRRLNGHSKKNRKVDISSF